MTTRPVNFSVGSFTSLDLMQLEPMLCAGLRKFFNFKGHSLHFPLLGEGEIPPASAEFLPDEGKLLLPLCRLAAQADSGFDNSGQDSFMGVFVARGVDESIRPILPCLPAAASTCLENLILYHRTLRDEVSGLFSRDYFLRLLTAELEKLREPLRGVPHQSGAAADEAFADAFGGFAAGGGGRFSLMTLRLNGLAGVVREHGYSRAERLLALLASGLEAGKPGRALAGRGADNEFCIILPGFGAQACQELAVDLASALDKVILVNEVSGRKASVSISVGYADCPRDLDGLERHTPAEQSRLLLRRARLAAVMAWEGRRLTAQAGARRFFSGLAATLNARPAVLSYRGVLAEGGHVLQVAPLSRLQVNLGKSSGARVGQRFTVWGYVFEGGAAQDLPGSPGEVTRRYKGEICLMDVRANEATAELTYCDDPYFPPEPGDQLLLVGPGQASVPTLPTFEQMPESALDPATGFLSYTDFLPAWCREREKHEKSALLLTRFSLLDQDFDLPESADEFELPDAANSPDESGASDVSGALDASEASDLPAATGGPRERLMRWEARWDKLMAACAEEFRHAFGPDCLYGRYAMNSFIVFVPDGFSEKFAGKLPKALPNALPDQLRLKAEELCGRLKNNQLACAVGIAPHPFLDFSRADGPDNAHKALEYALLLPFPQVGALDTLALNISADRRYSQGDSLGAISEYKKALLCDESNILAWNSLGVLLAGLGHSAEARRHFAEALRRDPDDPATLYNLGQLCQSTGEFDEAERLYSRCLELKPEGIYPLYRLGQLAEQRGDNRRAREHYSRAVNMPAARFANQPANWSARGAGGQGLARRGLARLAMREGRLEDAREELHEALLANPNDAVALQLLAGLYLDAGENPRVAESLARQAAALRPDLKAAWLELARALKLSGYADKAREALIRAGEL
ncbi:MAG: tetratricopeptide repeat protein [Deltaproteobacteria bacterium]|nr:tetratricopeptide repeat protein [Deltaproteobacteria bacterium]